MATTDKIGFGGGCHWCTEAVFQTIEGVEKVDQGWIASTGAYSSFSEGVIVHFDSSTISLKILIEIHLATHSCTVDHPMREKYRSAIYAFSDQQALHAKQILAELQVQYTESLVTKILPILQFKINQETYQEYYLKNPDKPFCQRYIEPKLSFLKKEFKEVYKKK